MASLLAIAKAREVSARAPGALVIGAERMTSLVDPTDRSTTLAHRKSKWIWSTPGADKSAPPGTVYLRKAFDLDDQLRNVDLIFARVFTPAMA